MTARKIHIQHELNRIQHRCGYLPADELKALSARAAAMGEPTPLRRLHEVASFFPHYRLEKPNGLEVKVCRDMTCHLRGASRCRGRLEELARRLGPGRLEVDGVSCLGQCDRAPAILIGDQPFRGHSIEEYEALVAEAVESGRPPEPQRSEPAEPDWKIDCYRGMPSEDRYGAVRKLAASAAPGEGIGADVIEALKVAGLRGMGGAGVAAFKKWGDVKKERPGGEKYVVCNGDESEPGTFKDRELLLRTPHLVIEGVILAGLVVGAQKGYIYIRHEYREQIAAVRHAIEEAERLKACGPDVFKSGRAFNVEVYESPGGYICGEQSALIEAMEDKRAEPRNKPPELATNGLWDRPTLVSNVETFAWAPAIVLRGGAWYRGAGEAGCQGRRFFSISGDVARPGVYEVPIGSTLGGLIKLAGGVVGKLKAVATSGPSGGFIPARVPIPGRLRLPESYPRDRISPGATDRDALDLELDIDIFRAFDLMLGAGIVVYAEGVDILDQAENCTQFFRNESCGKCVPCRLGTERLARLAAEIRAGSADEGRLRAIESEISALREALQQTSICGLGTVAPEPLSAALRFLRAESTRPSGPTEPSR